jgi:Pentapeptide repeats (8 copies)
MTGAADDKVQAEVDKLKAEAQKIRLECQKASRDLKQYQTFFRLEMLKAFGTAATFVVGLAAVLTFAWNVYTYNLDSTRKASEQVSALLKDLGHESSVVRLGAIFGMMPYMKDADLGDSIRLNLTYAIGLEKNHDIQNAIVQSLSIDKEKIAPLLRDARDRMASATAPLFNDLHRVESLIENGSGQPLEALQKRKQEIEREITQRQRGAVVISSTLRDISDCSRQPQKRCVLDLSGLHLKGMEFVGMRTDMRGSLFKDTGLWGADLYGLDLTGADFTSARLHEADLRRAILIRANFNSARMERMVQRAYKNTPTRFALADLSDATFVGACLGGADFSGALNLKPEQFKESFAAKATFDKEFEVTLQRLGFLKADPRCKEH